MSYKFINDLVVTAEARAAVKVTAEVQFMNVEEDVVTVAVEVLIRDAVEIVIVTVLEEVEVEKGVNVTVEVEALAQDITTGWCSGFKSIIYFWLKFDNKKYGCKRRFFKIWSC